MTDEKYMIDGNVVINKLAEQTMVLELASDTLIKTVDTVKIQTDNINVIINNQLRQEQKINDLEKFIKFFFHININNPYNTCIKCAGHILGG